MTIPTGDEYSDAVQNPKINFSDLDLKNGRIELNNIGLPKPYSGNFTTTFHLIIEKKSDWAVRCFTRNVPHLEKRYSEIGYFIQKNPVDFLVNAECVRNGILIKGKWNPIIKMSWIKGQLINVYIQNNINDTNKIKNLLNKFSEIIQKMIKLSIAHGDLQHGNIMVENDRLFLIDYDGIYLPSLVNNVPNELGHSNYQHPDRGTNSYNTKIDYFSSIAMHLSLSALISNPSLWNRYNNGENILFTKEDFTNPQNSKLFFDIKKIKELTHYIERFGEICLSEFNSIPSLDDFLSDNYKLTKKKVKPVSDEWLNNENKKKLAEKQKSLAINSPPYQSYNSQYSYQTSNQQTYSSTVKKKDNSYTAVYVVISIVIILLIIMANLNDKKNEIVNQPVESYRPAPSIPNKPIVRNETINYDDGSRYEGTVVNSKREGRGIFFYPQNNEMNYWKYVGEFKDDIIDGKGVLYFNDGTRYEGTWINDMREGRFIYFDDRGRKEIHIFSNGERIE